MNQPQMLENVCINLSDMFVAWKIHKMRKIIAQPVNYSPPPGQRPEQRHVVLNIWG
jgi:hypothetical protein